MKDKSLDQTHFDNNSSNDPNNISAVKLDPNYKDQGIIHINDQKKFYDLKRKDKSASMSEVELAKVTNQKFYDLKRPDNMNSIKETST